MMSAFNGALFFCCVVMFLAAEVDGKKFRWRVMFLLLTVQALASVIYQTTFKVLADAPPPDKADTAWVLTAAGLVLLMTVGLSFFYGGMVSEKNIISTMLQSFKVLGQPELLISYEEFF